MPPLLPKKSATKCDICDITLIEREDDNEATIKNRLEIFKKSTESILKYYEDKGILFSIEPKKGKDDYYKIKDLVFRHLKL